MKLRPLGNRVIVKAASKEEKTSSGLILPTAGNERPEQGEVIESGPGLLLENGTRQPMSVKVGDRIVFKKYSPDTFKIDEEEYLVLAETDIMAVMES